jgi:hypothetical protein
MLVGIVQAVELETGALNVSRNHSLNDNFPLAMAVADANANGAPGTGYDFC